MPSTVSSTGVGTQLFVERTSESMNRSYNKWLDHSFPYQSMSFGHYLDGSKEPVRNLKENEMIIVAFMKDHSGDKKTHGFLK